MPWVQQYAPVGGVVASACLAAIPLIILFYMLAVRKAKGHVAAAAGLIGALIVAVAVWNMPVSLAISSTLNGAAFGPVSYTHLPRQIRRSLHEVVAGSEYIGLPAFQGFLYLGRLAALFLLGRTERRTVPPRL